MMLVRCSEANKCGISQCSHYYPHIKNIVCNEDDCPKSDVDVHCIPVEDEFDEFIEKNEFMI